MSKTAAFPKILHVGDKQIEDLFDGPVEITEKLDGSQFGFGKVDGVLTIRSKGRELDLDEVDKMFGEGVGYVKSIEDRLPDNVFFYGEYFQKPRHSTLAYDRIPTNHIALFGVYDGTTRVYAGYEYIKKWADILGVDAVPIIHQGTYSPSEVLELVKDRVSYLGGQNIEGVVVKAYKPWLFLGQIPLSVMAGKYVTEAFKEVHGTDWTKLNTSKGKLDVLKDNFRSEARWNKAVQHIKEAGLLEGSPRDIGPLIKEVQRDLREEEKENIKEQLWVIFNKDILSVATGGLPQWYKEKIVLGETDGEVKEDERPEDNSSEGVQVNASDAGTEDNTDSEGPSRVEAPRT